MAGAPAAAGFLITPAGFLITAGIFGVSLVPVVLMYVEGKSDKSSTPRAGHKHFTKPQSSPSLFSRTMGSLAYKFCSILFNFAQFCFHWSVGPPRECGVPPGSSVQCNFTICKQVTPWFWKISLEMILILVNGHLYHLRTSWSHRWPR